MKKDYITDLVEGINHLEQFINDDQKAIDVLLSRQAYKKEKLKELHNTLEEFLKGLDDDLVIPPGQTVNEWVVQKLSEEFPSLFVIDSAVRFEITGIPLVKEDYKILRDFFVSQFENFKDLDGSELKIMGLYKDADKHFQFRYIFSPKGIPEKALANLPVKANPYFCRASVNDKVVDKFWGNGVITQIKKYGNYPLVVSFSDGVRGHDEIYNLDGHWINAQTFHFEQRLFYV